LIRIGRASLVRFGENLGLRSMGRGEYFNYVSREGQKLRGVLLLPANYRKDVTYPVIVDIYGDANVAGNLYEFGLGDGFWQLFASRGYVIFKPYAPNGWARRWPTWSRRCAGR